MIRVSRTHVGLRTVDSTHDDLTIEQAREAYKGFESNAKLRRVSRTESRGHVTYEWTNRPIDSANPKGVGSWFRLTVPE